MSRTVVVVAILAALASRALSAQTVLTGVVREDSTERLLSGVEVKIEDASSQAATDSAGRYYLSVKNGTRIALFRLPGFRPVRVRITAKGDTVRADATLVRVSSTQLEAVQVNAPVRLAGMGRDGFAERRARGFGKFIDSTAMRAREERRLTDVLRELTNVRVMEFRDPQSSVVEIRAVSPTSPVTQGYTVTVPGTGPTRMPGNPPCFVSVFFNGTSIYRSERASSGKPPDLSRDFTVASLESVEYYRSAAETPLEYGGGNANCGALVLWSRR